MDKNLYLFDLIRKHNWKEFSDYLKNTDDIDVNIRDSNNNYLITYAVLFNKKDIVSILIHKGSKIDIVDTENRSILYAVIKYGYDELLDFLLNFNETYIGISLIDIKDINGNIPLHYAIKSKNIEYIKKLLKVGSNINTTDKFGNNALHISVYNRDKDICKLILDNNININSTNKNGETALHIACNLELIEICELLIEYGINVDLQDSENEFTALGYSITRNNNRLTAILLKNKANPNIQDYFGNASLHYAIIEDNLDIFLQLTKSNYTKNIINYNLYNAESKLPFHLVTNTKNPSDYIELLIEKTNLNFQDNGGDTPLHYLTYTNDWKKYKNILKTKTLDIFIMNNSGISPISHIKKNKDEFINLVADSFLYTLKNSHYVWKYEWENICKKIKITIDDQERLDKIINNNKKNNTCKDIILNSIKEYNKSHPTKKTKIIINKNNKVDFCTFTGASIDILIGLIYLRDKHKSICTTLSADFINNENLCKFYKEQGIFINSKCNFLNFEISWTYQKLYMTTNFNKLFDECIKTNKRFVIIPLGIELRHGAHANYIIYDKKLNEIERFEPHGSGTPFRFDYNYEKLDSILKNKFSLIIDDVKYISPSDYLPKIGLQIFDSFETKCTNIGDPKGFCALWALWYVDFRASYPDIPRKELIEEIIKKVKINNLSFRNIIRNYSTNVTNIRDDVLKKANLNINDWLNDNYTNEQINKVTNELVKLIQKCN